ncbi:replication-relaxation family protein [Shimazuella kribbensis]|uniref:replication-relaxation family protein n=1 Tax=Shimazuella kribbensis TaxID=139808 RepID=UPI0003F8DB01|nr:replication-relaxation family protein [Shimazuella kribbensis]
MIFQWISHPALRPYERLMMVLFEMGMVTLEDLSVVMGYTEKRVFKIYQQVQNTLAKDKVDKLKHELTAIEVDSSLNDEQKVSQSKEIKKKIKKEKSRWTKSSRQITENRGSTSRVYSLGPKGVEYCLGIMNERGSWDIKDGQMYHYIGVNGILTRLINHYGRDNFNWYFSREATDIIIRTWEIIRKNEWSKDPKLAVKEKREIIRPDGLLVMDNQMYWMEFDNDTERSKQIIQKYREYRNTIVPKYAENLNAPVLWVTKTERRRDSLANNWEMVKEEYYSDAKVQQMYFFVEGEETEWLEKRHSTART